MLFITPCFLRAMNNHPEYHVIQSLTQTKAPVHIEKVSAEYVETQSAISNELHKMGCLILAGGQGTRLGFDGPKGCVELRVDGGKSLFQIHFEKIAKKGPGLSIAVMTSPLNDEETRTYFREHDFFGLEPNDIDFFPQEMMYASDSEGKLFYDAPNHLAEAPAGNGKALELLYRTGIWEKWKKKGIEVVQVMPVDNPLADPFDPELLGVHLQGNFELVLRAVERSHPGEKLGVLGLSNHRLYIREYSELSPELQGLHFSLGNTGIFSCAIDFIKKIQGEPLPWHLARKSGKRITVVDGKVSEEAIETLKLETFIFDLFPMAETFKIILSNRKECFAPLKNAVGKDSLETVADILKHR